MLNLRIGEEVWLCTHNREQRSAWVEELTGGTVWISFWANNSDLVKAEFSLEDGFNTGNRAYWIEAK